MWLDMFHVIYLLLVIYVCICQVIFKHKYLPMFCSVWHFVMFHHKHLSTFLLFQENLFQV